MRREQLTVALHNRGRTPITIQGTSSSCSCTVVSLPEQTAIPAGGSTNLTIAADVPVVGRVRATVTLATDSPVTPTVTIQLDLHGLAVPAPAITYQPKEIRHRAGPGTESAQEFEVTTAEREDADDWLTGFEADVPWLRVERLSREIGRRRSEGVVSVVSRFMVHWTESPPPGERLTAALTPLVESPAVKPVGQIPFVLEHPEALASLPSRLELARDQPVDLSLTLIAQDVAEWDCLVKSAPPGFIVSPDETRSSPLPEAKRFWVSWQPPAADAELPVGEIVFTTSLETPREFRVPISWRDAE